MLNLNSKNVQSHLTHSVLILYKLPFLVPSEPIIEAYLEKLQSEGKIPLCII